MERIFDLTSNGNSLIFKEVFCWLFNPCFCLFWLDFFGGVHYTFFPMNFDVKFIEMKKIEN